MDTDRSICVAPYSAREAKLNAEAWATVRRACLEAFRNIGMGLPSRAPENFARAESDWLQCPRYDLWLPGWRATRILCRVRLAYDPQGDNASRYRNRFWGIVAPYLLEGGFVAGRLGVPVWTLRFPERTLVRQPMPGWRWVNDYVEAVRGARIEEYRRIRLASHVSWRHNLNPAA